MRIELLTTIKTADGVYPKGTIFDDQIEPIPESIVDEAREGSNLLRVSGTIPSKKEKSKVGRKPKPQESVLDEAASEPSEEPPEAPKPRKASKKSAANKRKLKRSR